MDWISFPVFSYSAILLWIAGLILIYSGHRKCILKRAGIIFITSGVIIIASFAILLWIKIERPPLRTLGETRLWYVFFLSLSGLIFFLRWRYKWFLTFSLIMSMVFIIFNIAHPETFHKDLMPALQSPWFIPHVIAYILGYALLGVSAIVATYGLFVHGRDQGKDAVKIFTADNTVYQGFAFLSLGLLFGAMWAK